jgi:hypothetical protein
LLRWRNDLSPAAVAGLYRGRRGWQALSSTSERANDRVEETIVSKRSVPAPLSDLTRQQSDANGCGLILILISSRGAIRIKTLLNHAF